MCDVRKDKRKKEEKKELEKALESGRDEKRQTDVLCCGCRSKHLLCNKVHGDSKQTWLQGVPVDSLFTGQDRFPTDTRERNAERFYMKKNSSKMNKKCVKKIVKIS